jgi:glycosidase
VGHELELAPRDPDPEASYRWRVVDAPAGSTATVGSEPVERFVPDRAGVYTFGLDAPDGDHHLTARVFPADRAVEAATAGADGGSGASGGSEGAGGPGTAGVSGVSGPVEGGSARRGDQPDHGPGEGRPRVRLDGGTDAGVVTLSATARAGVTDEPDRSLDVEFYVDDRDEATLEADGPTATLPVPDEPVRVHAVSVGDTYSVPDAVRVHPDGSVERLYDPPDWSTSVTLYEIYVRGFAGDDEFSFAALEERLGYLADLGVDTVWLTPVLQHDGWDHGYNIVDFFSIADDLGSREEFERFVERAHEHGIRVLFDLVLNHSARDHPYFQSAYENPESEYHDWYDWQDSGEPETYFEWEYIANFDFSTLAVRRHLLDAVDTWAELVDGFRCDMAWAVPRTFWEEIRDRVKAHDQAFLLLDETIPYVAEFHGSMFDMHFDTTLYFTLRQVGRGNEAAEAVADAIDQRRRVGFPPHAAFMTYIENHDETRYLAECGRGAVEAAAAAQLTLPGVPMLYSGQELGMRQRRGPVDWDAADDSLYAHYRSLVRTRGSIPALGYEGGFDRTPSTGGDRVVAYARTTPAGTEADHDRYVVVLNFGESPALVDLPGESVLGRDAVTDEPVRAESGLRVESVAILPAEPRGR